jgi:proline dehydrogenase
MIEGPRRLLEALARHAARGYVIGPDLGDATKACRYFAGQGFSSTICAWNGEEDLPIDNAARCLSGIENVATEQLDCHVSLKALDVKYSPPLIGEIAASARRRNVGLHFDSMGPEGADKTFAILDDLARSSAKLGCTIPGRWQRSLADADRAADLGLRVRVVKGQWADPDRRAIDLGDGFFRVIDRLAGKARHVAVATHDPSLARISLARLLEAGTCCELELLFGLPSRDAIRAAHEMNVPIRIYIPYGRAWLPYAFGQIRRNPKIAFWALRDLVSHGRPDVRLGLRARDP